MRHAGQALVVIPLQRRPHVSGLELQAELVLRGGGEVEQVLEQPFQISRLLKRDIQELPRRTLDRLLIHETLEARRSRP
jgi:hypothetical protein